MPAMHVARALASKNQPVEALEDLLIHKGHIIKLLVKQILDTN